MRLDSRVEKVLHVDVMTSTWTQTLFYCLGGNVGGDVKAEVRPGNLVSLLLCTCIFSFNTVMKQRLLTMRIIDPYSSSETDDSYNAGHGISNCAALVRRGFGWMGTVRNDGLNIDDE